MIIAWEKLKVKVKARWCLWWRIDQANKKPKDSFPRACPSSPILILLFAAVVLAIATIFGDVFGLRPRGFAGFNVENNLFNNECELEKSGLINKKYHNTNDLTLPPNDTVFYFGRAGAGLCKFNVCGCVDGVFNENEFYCDVNNIFNNEINNECELENGGLCNGSFSQKSGVSDFRIHDFDIIGCVFGGILCENEFYYYVNDIFDYFNAKFYDNDIFIYLFILLIFIFFEVVLTPVMSSHIYSTTTTTTAIISNCPTYMPRIKYTQFQVVYVILVFVLLLFVL